mmetsp:Transcript_15698/g.37560  ORF Transcript_15698/g.37560 Transcript_15698/m.37560 type:complete len:217 (-) Transcript_15698:171-821(-)
MHLGSLDLVLPSDALEGRAVDRPKLTVLRRTDGGRTRRTVHQCQLSKGRTSHVGYSHLDLVAAGTGIAVAATTLLGRHPHGNVEAALLNDEEVLSLITLLDDGRTLGVVGRIEGIDEVHQLLLRAGPKQRVGLDGIVDELPNAVGLGDSALDVVLLGRSGRHDGSTGILLDGSGRLGSGGSWSWGGGRCIAIGIGGGGLKRLELFAEGCNLVLCLF